MAKDLYISPLFKYNFRFAQTFKPNEIFILSAKYGLIKMEQEIEPYDLTLNKMTTKEIKFWSEKVLEQLKNVANLENDEFIFLAGMKYRKFLLPYIAYYNIPMKGMKIGKQLQFLKRTLS